jgi:hypothetical protein
VRYITDDPHERDDMRSVAGELEAEADLTDPAVMEWMEAYARSQRRPSLQNLTRNCTNLASYPAASDGCAQAEASVFGNAEGRAT